MYEDKDVTYKIGINWKDVIIKIILLILFIVLLIWLFPNPQLDTFYDGVFNDNIQTMKEAAKSYYTVERLPNNIGESRSMTLKEMINNHMLIEFVDKDNKVCNENDSYVQVTKTGDNEYVLKVQLSCGEQSDYILETIGCYDVCPNGNCNQIVEPTPEPTETALQYQFKKEVDSNVTTYTCPIGYTKKGAKCYKSGTTQTINATATYFGDSMGVVDAKKNTTGSYTIYADPLKKAGSLICPTGYTSNGTQCVKVYNASSATSSGAFTCPSGYTLSGTQCYKTYSAKYTSGSSSYSCPSGYTLSGSTCYKSYQATYTSGSSSYYCPYGTRNGTQCVYRASYKAGSSSQTCSYGTLSGNQCVYKASGSSSTCPAGYRQSGSTCVDANPTSGKTVTTYGSWYVAATYLRTTTLPTYSNPTEKLEYKGYTYEETCGNSICPSASAHYKYILYKRNTTTTTQCPTGYNQSNGKCYKPNVSLIPGSQTCPHGGSASNGYCYLRPNTSSSAGTYYCPYGGSVSGTNCTYSATKSNGSGSYSCPSGGSLNGSTCVMSTTASRSTTSGAYSCPEGGTRNGTICRINVAATKGNGSTVFTCPYGGTLNGAKCTTYTEGYASTTYYCPTGYTSSGSGSSLKCSKQVTGSSTYYCEDANARLDGNKCHVTIKGSISGYTCPAGYTRNGTKCSKTNTIIIDATASTSTSKSYKYTWSNSQTLDGWIATGKTRLVNVDSIK